MFIKKKKEKKEKKKEKKKKRKAYSLSQVNTGKRLEGYLLYISHSSKHWRSKQLHSPFEMAKAKDFFLNGIIG